MGGWYLDVLVGYLVRIAIRTFKARGDDTWPVERATITGSRIEGGYGGPVAEITYFFTHEGEYLSGMHREPFLFRSSAEEYAARFPVGGKIMIRVNPRDLGASIVRDIDQVIGIPR